MPEFVTERQQGPTAVPPTGPEALDGAEAAAILERARASVDPGLRAAVDSLPVSMRRIARYHFGWVDGDGTPAAGDAGAD
ncbi:polyprenyl synthetase family protein, partial [Streptomyces sp. NPDC127079]